ncbi:hypothetical protein [Catenulispora subtropica]|uniref:Uncharacterized protein n=1 Tax=Catenulispora subtropica TaxID=450798 RepID=A0ABN2SNH9_9ACTN
MTLAWIPLASGRDIELNRLEIFSTYGGMLEGYPCALINDRLLSALSKRPESPFWTPPVHVITPPRSYPEPKAARAFGPVEVLPGTYCRGAFQSDRVDERLDDVLYRSYLTVVWFQEGLDGTVADFVTAALSSLQWEQFAEDSEL